MGDSHPYQNEIVPVHNRGSAGTHGSTVPITGTAAQTLKELSQPPEDSDNAPDSTPFHPSRDAVDSVRCRFRELSMRGVYAFFSWGMRSTSSPSPSGVSFFLVGPSGTT